MVVAISIFATFFIALIIYSAFPPLGKLPKILSPYDSVVRVRIDGTQVVGQQNRKGSTNFIGELFKPLLEFVSKLLSSFLLIQDEQTTLLRLSQAGIDEDIDAYRISMVKRILLFIGVGFLLGAGLGNPTAIVFFPIMFGFIAITKSRSRVDKAIEARRQTIRYELYSINQLLALHIRTGSGVSQSMSAITRRTYGIIANDFKIILSRSRSGMPLDESLYLAAKQTPEPHCARTYKLLAASSQRGADLTQGLLDLAQDLRRSLREDVKATSTKRRAAMLVPTIGILAPIMLLFVAAPIPSIVLGGN